MARIVGKPGRLRLAPGLRTWEVFEAQCALSQGGHTNSEERMKLTHGLALIHLLGESMSSLADLPVRVQCALAATIGRASRSTLPENARPA